MNKEHGSEKSNNRRIGTRTPHILLLIGLLLQAIALLLFYGSRELSSSRTPVPLLTPASTLPRRVTRTLTPTNTAIATPQATPTPISAGRLEITYPLEMTIEESDIVAVEIIADPRLTKIGVHPPYVTGIISIETTSQDGDRRRIEDKIRLYPVMSAELTAPNFDITHGDVDARRTITTTHPAAWTWNIAARKPGEQRITINIFGETTVGGEKFTVLEKSKARNITVLEKALSKRILDGLVNDFVAIVGTGGPLGLIIAYLTFRANRANKKMQEKIESLEHKLKELEEAQKPSFLKPSVEDEVAYWLIPVRSDEERTAGEIMLTQVEDERVYVVGERASVRTRLRLRDWICFYETGKGVIAHARVISKPEKRHNVAVHHPEKHPYAFRLDNVNLYLGEPVVIDVGVRSRLDTFQYRNPRKPWGWFVRTAREITKHDFDILTRQKATT